MSKRIYNQVIEETDNLPKGCLLTDHELKSLGTGQWDYVRTRPKTKKVTTKSENVYWSFGLRFTTEML